MKDKLVSIIAPMYNEESAIESFFTTVQGHLDVLPTEYEIICVDDGSSDNTGKLIREFAAKDDRIKLISFVRNFGKEAAMTAAIDMCRGDAVIPIDVDLQDPPELILQMVEKWCAGAKVVLAKRSQRNSDTLTKKLTASWFYMVFNTLSDTEIPYNVGDYRLMDREVIEVIKLLPEKERFMKGLFSWAGFPAETIEYERPARTEGESKFSFWKLCNFAISGIISFSTSPLRLGIYLGLVVSTFSFLYAVYLIVKTMMFGVDVPGYASIIVIVLFLGGAQLFFLGVVGEYIGRIYKEVKNRPLYVVAEKVGFKD